LKERLISVSAVLMLVVTSLTHPSIYPRVKCISDVSTHSLAFISFSLEVNYALHMKLSARFSEPPHIFHMPTFYKTFVTRQLSYRIAHTYRFD
jgi:hypothetical protein